MAYSYTLEQKIRANVEKIGHPIEEEIRLNPNSGKNEFSVRDLDGYNLTICENHFF